MDQIVEYLRRLKFIISMISVENKRELHVCSARSDHHSRIGDADNVPFLGTDRGSSSGSAMVIVSNPSGPDRRFRIFKDGINPEWFAAQVEIQLLDLDLSWTMRGVTETKRSDDDEA